MNRKSSSPIVSVSYEDKKANTDQGAADLLADFFQPTFSSSTFATNPLYPYILQKQSCICEPVITEVSILNELNLVKPSYLLVLALCWYCAEFLYKTLLSLFTSSVNSCSFL